MIASEIKRAEILHPSWPKDYVYGAAIISEESGELIRAAINYTYGERDYNSMKEEAHQVINTAIRFLIKLDNYENEIWKPVSINNFKDSYEISSIGNIRKTKLSINKALEPLFIDDDCVVLDNRLYRRDFSVTILVALAFLKIPIFKNAKIKYKNNDRLDKCFDNLEWVLDAK